jgi:hypothetical protein
VHSRFGFRAQPIEFRDAFFERPNFSAASFGFFFLPSFIKPPISRLAALRCPLS